MDIYADLYIGLHSGGCTNRIYKHLQVENNLKVHFPTGFKIDGVSREYKPIGIIESNKSYYFAIFNRNGMRLFETRDLNVGWDGKYKGEWVHPGVYVYYYKETYDRFTTEVNGTITVVK
ncbi:MAG: gliding motility-associated C-terminal domain-containing protein [Bacteroidales bacterium]|nr:gliding motility-associated C-terminal domain-containing protein [Bacteroidales bacterium]MDE7091035.1 gliding motility-associated C-terminal domain-containing protein [Bacteroidales bacterium]MDE7102926.1 gliding motility-associated C-terminal domain-containing protein [Bacteroidales bacterium]